MKSEDRSTARKVCFLAVIFFFALGPTLPDLGLNLSSCERLTDNRLNRSAVATRIFFSIVECKVCYHKDSHRTEKKEGKLHRKLTKKGEKVIGKEKEKFGVG